MKGTVSGNPYFEVRGIATDELCVGVAGVGPPSVGVRAKDADVQLKPLNQGGQAWTALTGLKYDPVTLTYPGAVDRAVIEVARILREDAQAEYDKLKQESVRGQELSTQRVTAPPRTRNR